VRRGFNSNLNFFQSFNYFPYLIANIVVFNSKDTYKKISFYCFPLRFKSVVIYNLTLVKNNDRKTMEFNRFSFIANYRPEKNHSLLLDTVKQYKDNLKGFHISCYGNNFFSNNRPTDSSFCYINLVESINVNKLSDYIKLNEFSDNIFTAKRKSAAYILEEVEIDEEEGRTSSSRC
jgi:hypothetical protein